MEAGFEKEGALVWIKQRPDTWKARLGKNCMKCSQTRGEGCGREEDWIAELR